MKLDFDSLRFAKEIENIARLSKNGILPFSKCTIENMNKFVFYFDDTKEVCRAILRTVKNSTLVAIPFTTPFTTPNIEDKVQVEFDFFDKSPFISIRNKRNKIIIKDGEWYFD